MQKSLSYGFFGRLVIHTPHAGTLLPIGGAGHPIPTFYRRKAIKALHNILCDHYTDRLFASDSPCIPQISFPYSRLFCDVERLLDDPLEKKGLGICYDLSHVKHVRHFQDPIWTMTKDQAMAMYRAHHTALSLAMSMGGLLLDCHSFSEQDNILCLNAHEYKDIDICIGFNEDDSKPDDVVIKFIDNFFRHHGYSVVFNKPFSNAMVANTFIGHRSLMIEVNKHCYMNEDTLEITAGYYKLHAELQELYHLLLN